MLECLAIQDKRLSDRALLGHCFEGSDRHVDAADHLGRVDEISRSAGQGGDRVDVGVSNRAGAFGTPHRYFDCANGGGEGLLRGSPAAHPSEQLLTLAHVSRQALRLDLSGRQPLGDSCNGIRDRRRDRLGRRLRVAERRMGVGKRLIVRVDPPDELLNAVTKPIGSSLDLELGGLALDICPLLETREHAGREHLLQDRLTFGALRLEELGEFTLRQHDRLEELALVEADDRLDLELGLAVCLRDEVPAMLTCRTPELNRRSSGDLLTFAIAPGPHEFRGAAHAVASGCGAELDFGKGLDRCVSET